MTLARRAGVLDELELHRLVRGVDAGDAERARRDAHLVAVEECASRPGRCAEAVDQLLAAAGRAARASRRRQALVQRQALVDVAQ